MGKERAPRAGGLRRVAFAAALAWGCRPEPLGASDPGADPLDASALHDATFALTSIGPRQVATPGEEEARAWMEAALREAGLRDVASEPFVLDAWRPGEAEIVSGGETIEVEALSPTGPTDVTLTLADASGGFEGAALLLPAAGTSRADAYFTAALGGAAALLRVTDELDHDGGPLVEVGHLVDGTTLPAVALDQATGERLAARIGQPVRLRVSPRLAPGHTSYNVSGRLPARDGGSSGRVYVVGHYDSWHNAECAFDNALGAAALVQLARRAASGPLPSREIVFLATSGEEQGLKGAAAWVAEREGEISPSDLVLVLDVVWSGEGSYLALATDDALRSLAIDAAADEGLSAADGGGPGVGSDHVPFVALGADAIWLGRWPDRHYHTVADTLDNLDLDGAAAALRTQWRLLADRADLSP